MIPSPSGITWRSVTPTRSGIKKRSVISSLFRIALSLALLALLAWWLDAGAVLGRLAGFDGLQECEAMKIRVAGADTADTMLSHENRGLSVVHEVSRQHRHLTDHLIEFGAFVIGLAFRGDEMAGCDDST